MKFSSVVRMSAGSCFSVWRACRQTSSPQRRDGHARSPPRRNGLRFRELRDNRRGEEFGTHFRRGFETSFVVVLFPQWERCCLFLWEFRRSLGKQCLHCICTGPSNADGVCDPSSTLNKGGHTKLRASWRYTVLLQMSSLCFALLRRTFPCHHATWHRVARTAVCRLYPFSTPTPLLRTICAWQVPIFEKTLFSMCTEKVMKHVDSLSTKPTDVVLFGIEAHVCVTQVCVRVCERERERETDRQRETERDRERQRARVRTLDLAGYLLCGYGLRWRPHV